MTKSGFDRNRFALAELAIVIALGVAAQACTTPATADPPVSGSGGASTGTSSGGSPGSLGSGGATLESSGGSNGGLGSGGVSSGSGGSGTVDPGATGGAAQGASGGATGSGGAMPGGGTGGKVAAATGGTTGAGGAPGAGGATAGAGSGCNWKQNPDGTWAMGTPAAADKIVLFDGTTLAGWHKLNMPTTPIDWKLVGDGTMQVVPSGTGQAVEVQSNMKFDDLCLHVEYMTPTFMSSAMVQQQGNSGVYLKSAYEMQILDTHNLGPLIDGCGAVYEVAAPLVVACTMYGTWNTYEIEFKSSVWDNSTPPKKTKDASFVKVTLNGKLVQMNVDLNPVGGCTRAGIPDAAGPQPVGLQDHLDKVSFRNIWANVPK